jgi:hypothetical protein
MAKTKKAVTGTEEKLIPFGYTEGTDVVEFLITFGFNSETDSIEDFIEKTWNIK